MIVKEVAPVEFEASALAPARSELRAPRPWPLADHPAFFHPITGDWAVMACHFNPAGFRRPVENLGAFLDWCHASRLPLFMAELCFHDAPPLLPMHSARVRRFRSTESGVMFQKEALLQLLSQCLPAAVQKVFCVDADVVYSDPECFAKAAKLLNSAALVQPFHRACWLDQYSAIGPTRYSTAWAISSPEPQPHALDAAHFHPGFAFGVRRAFFRDVGLYGCPITGTGDAALFQAAMAPYCAPVTQGRSHYTAPSPEAWRASVAAHVQGNVACVPGTAFHFYHGSSRSRSYDQRHGLLSRFHPTLHLTRRTAASLPEWTPAASRLQAAMRAYFASRNEDA